MIFTAYIGGLLGLFMGFSMFSIIEGFYFLTIRPYSNYVKLSHKRRLAFQRMVRKFRNFRSRRTLSASIVNHVNHTKVQHITYVD